MTTHDQRSPLLIELFALDTDHCHPCRSAVTALEVAAAELSRDAGPPLEIRVVRLNDADEARRLGVVSSPTVRVAGHDIALTVEERECDSCSALAHASVACRTYVWHGERHDHPPAALVVEAVRRHLAGPAVVATDSRDPHLRARLTSVDRFFRARAALTETTHHQS